MSVYEDESFSASIDPLPLVVKLARAGLFDDYVVYESGGRWTVAGGALATVSLDAKQVKTQLAGEDETARAWTGSPADALRHALDALPIQGWNAYGWLGFDFAGLIASLVSRGAEAPSGELARLIVPRTEVRVDERGVVVRGVDEAERARVLELLREPVDPIVPSAIGVDVRADGEGYRDRVAQAVKEIQLGQYQKVILSRTVRIPFEADMVGTYEVGRRGNTPARSFLLRMNGTQAAGFSPEVIVTVDAEGHVLTQPLAGTRAFGRGVEADAAARSELESDPKEVFEHAVSVRAAQEELRGVCRTGTVGVDDFMGIKERGSVQHLASLVTGTLDEKRTSWDALEAVFPAITASGIPKRESLDAIFRLDETRRGLYSGAVLSASHDGALDAALVLRAVYQQDGQAWLRAGAGIVTDSTPEREFEETCEKLSSVAPFVVRAD
ncbi:salicylate synthase [Amycolatopsis sp. NPDC059657]|uniref:salicylate synthase n=1 Tax=Amycolatopsis sp. NPDC059657 TaxID=3346899 RepID=UPI003670C6E5